MNTDWKFTKNVILLDTSFINQTVRMVSEVMSARMGRPLPPLDLVAWLDCLLLDAGLRGTNQEVQVLLTRENKEDSLHRCAPASLSQLDGQACRTTLAEYTFYVVGTEGLTTHEELYNDLLTLLLHDEGIQTRLLVPSAKADESQLNALLQKGLKDRKNSSSEHKGETVWFRLEAPSSPLACTWCPAVPSLAHVLGIRDEDLK